MNKASDWLFFAESDLKSTKLLSSEGIYNEACFHAQQTAEKCLKAILAGSGERIPKIHSLVALYEKTTQLAPNLSTLKDAFEFLEPFYMTTRYPDASPGSYAEKVPSAEETEQALEHATKILDFVSLKINGTEPNQRGFAPILILLLLTLGVIVLFVPIPHQDNSYLCPQSYGVSCNRPWVLGPSLWQRLTSQKPTADNLP